MNALSTSVLVAACLSTFSPSVAFSQTNDTPEPVYDSTLTSYTLLPLPSTGTDIDAESGAPLKKAALAEDLDTSISAPEIEKPKIYWGDVGEDGGYSVNAVMNIAWKANPNWATFAANHAAAHAELIQARAIPNPEVETEFGSESSRETNDSRGIWSLGFSQPIELPGKRAARQAEALAGFSVVQGEQLEYANTLRADVREAYWTVQYYAALEQMYVTQINLTQGQVNIANKRVELGDASRIELVNAKMELLKARRDRETARRKKAGAKAALNALAGGRLGSDFKLAQNFADEFERPPLQAAIAKALSSHPKLARMAAELEQKYAGIARQKKEWWPDIRVGARKSREFDSDSMAVTAGIEIPLWNRNEGGIARAEAEAQKVYAQIGIAYNDLRRDVEVAWQALMLARDQIASYNDGLRDAAEEVTDLAYQQFTLGGAGYIDVLIARRQLVETQQGYIQALYDAATAKARFDQAIGQ